MKSLKRKIVMAALVCVSAAGVVLAQSSDPLPSKLTGRWTAIAPRGTYIDSVSLTVDGHSQPGAVTGRVMWRGVICGAQDEPFTGTWDGTELRVNTTHCPDVNVQRMGGQCGTGRVTCVLRRKPGEKTFEGEGRMEGSATVATISVSP